MAAKARKPLPKLGELEHAVLEHLWRAGDADVLETAKANMEAYEWAYWMEGKPAEKDIKAPDGTLLEKAGTVRDGGSYEARMGGVACWNAVMDENDYMVRKWNEFIAA